MTVFTRYLLRAHLGPFIFAFVALTGVILINTLAKELANLAGKGLPLGVVLEFFVLSLPANIALTLPMAVLVAVLYTFSSLASDNEITALRASGIDLRRVTFPLIIVAALIAGGMVWFSDQVLPAANYRWRVLMTDVASTRPLLVIREQTINPIPTADGRTPYYLEAQQVDVETGRMRQVSIYDVSDDRVTRTITADSGRMASNEAQTDLLLTLYDGNVREVDFMEIGNFQVVGFQKQVMRMDGVSDRLERSAESTFRTDRDMTLAMMRARIDTLRVELRNLQNREAGATADSGELALEEADTGSADAGLTENANPDISDSVSFGLSTDSAGVGLSEDEDTWGSAVPDIDPPAAGIAALEELSEPVTAAPTVQPTQDQSNIISAERDRYTDARIRSVQGQIREFQVEIQKKYSIAGATLVFVLIGIPIALRFPRGGIGMVIGVSLAIFGIYYVGLIGGETLGDAGYVPPSIGMWATNIVFGTLGLLGFMRLGHEQGTTRGGSRELPRWLRWRPRSRTNKAR